MDLYIVDEKGWPTLRFERPSDPRFKVIATFTGGDEDEALSLLEDLTVEAISLLVRQPGSLKA